MALRRVLSAVRKLRKFIPGSAARSAVKKARSAKFAKGKARVASIKSQKKIDRARNIASLRRKRLRGDRFNAIKSRVPSVLHKAALPSAALVGGATAGFVVGRRRRNKATRR